MITQLREKGMPERIVFVHIEYSGYTYSTTWSLILRKYIIVEISIQLIFIKIRDVIHILILAYTPFTSITRDISSSSSKFIDGKSAIISTFTAASK